MDEIIIVHLKIKRFEDCNQNYHLKKINVYYNGH